MLLHSKYLFRAVHRCDIPIVPYSLNFSPNNSDSFAYCCSVSKTIVRLSVRFSLHINPLVLHSIFLVDQAKWQYTHIIRASGTCSMCAVGKQMFFFPSPINSELWVPPLKGHVDLSFLLHISLFCPPFLLKCISYFHPLLRWSTYRGGRMDLCG